MIKGWLVWSNYHDQWWGPDECGYTLSLERAGRYTLTDAVRIMSKRSKELGLIPCEIPVPSPELIQELLADENHR